MPVVIGGVVCGGISGSNCGSNSGSNCVYLMSGCGFSVDAIVDALRIWAPACSSPASRVAFSDPNVTDLPSRM